jgi:NADH pyrophosphatase NudC (nudix superfamily)
MKLHSSLTAKKIEAAVRKCMTGLDNIGFCRACGKKANGVEPDARKYECSKCGKLEVYGAEELLFEVY